MKGQKESRRKVEMVTRHYPNERERIEKCAAVIEERDSEMLYQAFEKSLDRIAAASNPSDARKLIDKMEHTLHESRLMSPFLGAREGNTAARTWIQVSVIVLLIGLIAASTYMRIGL